MADQKHTYVYRAINDEGVTLTGDIEAESAEQARQALLGRGLMPSRGYPSGRPLEEQTLPKILPEAGHLQTDHPVQQTVPHVVQRRRLHHAAFGHPPDADGKTPRSKPPRRNIAQQVSTGGTLYNAFRSHPDIFSPLYCSMIRAGEFSGSMATCWIASRTCWSTKTRSATT